jgi:RNA recognition motif-containing protein
MSTLSSENEKKVFVGNVPFDCDNAEFISCFSHLNGYISAELINKKGEDSSRGFGFVAFKTINDTTFLLKQDNIYIRERKLRFTSYSTQKPKAKTTTNYILLSDITQDITREDILTEFKVYSDIGKCFIMTNRNTGDFRDLAIVEVLDNDSYAQLIELEQMYINNFIISLRPFNVKKQKNVINTNKEIFDAFEAGRNIGRIEGLKLINKA